MTKPAESSQAKEHPILFSSEMVRAILDGLKTQTRKVVKPQPPFAGSIAYPSKGVPDAWNFRLDGYPKAGLSNLPLRCPYGEPATRLWVRETWRVWSWHEGEPVTVQYRDGSRRETDSQDTQAYWDWEERVGIQSCADLQKAGFQPDDSGIYHVDGELPTRWRPSIHMPRSASRITLKVTDVRVERVQEVTEADAVAEGVQAFGPAALTDRTSFAQLWDSINAKRGYSWDSNPWVWIVEFEKLTP